MRSLNLRIVTIAATLLAAALTVSCSRERFEKSAPSPKEEPAGLVLDLSRGGNLSPAASAVEADSFWVEIYNSKAIRFFSRQYKDIKGQPINMNAGQFRLIAFSGDSLGAGFDKAYYLADTTFTVHGLMANGGNPDRVSVTARRGNVEVAVNFGENLKTYYSNYYAIVRHEDIARKSVKFLKDESRHGFIPGGKVYVEVFAQLGGKGMQDGGVKDSLVYFRAETKTYLPGDLVTFNIDCAERQGALGIGINLISGEETLFEEFQIPESALGVKPPSFSFHGEAGNSFSDGFSVGAGSSAGDAALNFFSEAGVAEAVLYLENEYLNGTLGIPDSISLVNPSNAERSALGTCGIIWEADENEHFGYFNIGGLYPVLSPHCDYFANNPTVARARLKVTDLLGKTRTATLDLNGKPVSARVYASAENIWGWKIAEPYAIIDGVDEIAPQSNITLLSSSDGQTWKRATSKSFSGNKVYFNDATGLTAGQDAFLKVMIGDAGDNVSETTVFTTESPQQLPNSGFEDFSEQATEVPTFKIITLVVSKFTITWWQLYPAGGTRFWAVNSLVSIREEATAAYQDYKSYPTVAVFNQGAYSGNSIQVATIAEGNVASDAIGELAYGTYHAGELFIGRANDEVYGNWAKISEGGALGSRPRALRFQHKFNCNGSKPYYVHIEILDADGGKIGEATKNDQTSSVNSWTAVTIPINYTVTNRKAASIKLSFMSSRDGSDDNHRSVTVNTLSGEHKIHAGNILSLDNVELVYSE